MRVIVTLPILTTVHTIHRRVASNPSSSESGKKNIALVLSMTMLLRRTDLLRSNLAWVMIACSLSGLYLSNFSNLSNKSVKAEATFKQMNETRLSLLERIVVVLNSMEEEEEKARAFEFSLTPPVTPQNLTSLVAKADVSNTSTYVSTSNPPLNIDTLSATRSDGGDTTINKHQFNRGPQSIAENTHEQTNNAGKERMTFQLNRRSSVAGHNDENPFSPLYHCSSIPGSDIQFSPLPPALQKRGVLDFTTTLSTNLRILTMGDSVGILFAQNLEWAAGASSDHRQVLWYTRKVVHKGLAVAAPVRGGGVMASWRITGWLLRRGEGKPLPNASRGGWVREDVYRLQQHQYHPLQTHTDLTRSIVTAAGNSTAVQVGAMDALVFRIPMGWIAYATANPRHLAETIEVANELFGVTTVIFVTAPFDNNVGAVWRLHKFNKMVRDFCHSWQPQEASSNSTQNGGVKHVLFLDFAALMHDLIETNALSIGMNVSGSPDDEYMMKRLSIKQFPPSIAQVCYKLPANATHDSCTRVPITSDGKHPCMENLGGRINGGISCLLGCAFNQNVGNVTESSRTHDCKADCNRKFMSLLKMEDADIGTR